MGNYVRFKRPRRCPGVHLDPYFVSVGDLVEFQHHDHPRLGRVLGLVKRDGAGRPHPGETLLVLVANVALTSAYERHVPIQCVKAIHRPASERPFATWFLTGELPADPQVVIDAVAYGAMSDRHLGKYLDADGRLVPSCRDADAARDRANRAAAKED
jgi:hypothetical protein